MLKEIIAQVNQEHPNFEKSKWPLLSNKAQHQYWQK
jgi:hypothetical protein